MEKGFSGNTIFAYRNDLYGLIGFLDRQGYREDWTSINSDVLASYVLELQEKGYSVTTRARKLASVKSLFSFLLLEGIVSQNPTEDLHAPKVGRTLPNTLSEDEVARLLEAPSHGTGPEALRDHAMLELLYATGMRVTELVSLNLSDINPNEGYVRCMGKGSKERIIPTHGMAVAVLRTYLEDGRTELARNGSEPALFLNRRGERLTRQGVLGHPQRTRKAGASPGQRYAAHPSSQLCDSHAPRRCYPTTGSGVPGPRQHFHHAGVHAPYQRSPARRVQSRSP